VRQNTLNWNLLQPVGHNLHDLDKDISDGEIHAAVMQTADVKSPGPYGFIGSFFKCCWELIKHDLAEAIREIFALRGNCWNLLNSVNVILIEKKEGVQEISGYRSISIIHSVGKLLTKILANRLGPHLDKLVSHSQSAFIKGRSIHNNFQLVKGVVDHFNQAKTPMMLLKLFDGNTCRRLWNT
jgi:hypothetical protein